MPRFLLICASVFLFIASSLGLFSQSGFPIQGIVTDPSGAAVSSSPIELQSENGQIVAKTTSSDTGTFSFHSIPPGNYVLTVPPNFGFALKTQPIRVASRALKVTIKLVPGSVVQSVTVAGDSTQSVDSSANTDTISLGNGELQQVPIFDQDLIGTLTPFLDPGSISAGGVSILVDGVEMKTATVSPSAIADVRMNTDPYSAEFGRPGRGRLEIMTKPGGTQFHGEFNFLTRDATLNASNYFAISKPPEQRRIYEGHLTGPVGRGAGTSFLFSGDRREDDAYAFVHAIGPNGLVTGDVSAPIRDTEISFRVTHDFSAAHRLSVGYNVELDSNQNGNVGGLVLAEAGYNTVGREDDLIFNDRILISPMMVNQLQVTLEKDEDVTKSVTSAPSIQVDSSFTGGGAQADVARTENTIHINEVASITHKNHYIRFGFNGPQISRRADDDHTNRLGTFAFNSLADYTNAQPYVFTLQQGAGRGIYWINEIGGFAQDEIKLKPNLQVTLGLRYQWQTYITAWRNFAPRLSAAYSINKSTLIRAGGGVFFDRTGGDFPATFKVHNGVVLRSYQVLNPGYPNPLPPGEQVSSLPTSIVREAPNLRAPYSIQYSIGLERQLTPKLTFSAGYRGITGISNFRSRDANAPLPPLYAQRPDPSLAFVQQVEAGGRLRSNALDISLRGRAGRWFTGQAQYTLARSYDNTGGIGFFPQNQYDPSGPEWGRSNFDRLHKFNMLATVNSGHWLSLGIGTTVYSGTPYTELAGSDLYQTGLGNARPPGVGRNTLQAGGTTDLDLLWNHAFKLNHPKDGEGRAVNIGISSFNVLNHPNFTNYAGNIKSRFFQQPTAALPGRQLQFSVGYQF